MIRYELPYPPSVNNLFANAKNGGRYPVPSYKAWRNEAGEQILAQGRKRLRGRFSLAIYVVRPDRRKRDVANLIKAVEDLLVEMQIVEDDSLAERVTIQWADEGSFECLVVVQPAEEMLAA